MNKFATVRGYGRKFAAGAAGLAVSGLAMAQAADPFTDAVATATVKVGTYGTALVGLSAVGVVFMIAMKYVKRIPRAS